MERTPALFEIAKPSQAHATARRLAITLIGLCILTAGDAAGQTPPGIEAKSSNGEPKKILLTIEQGSTAVNTNLTVKWEANYAPSRLAFFFSANDGRTWKPWTERSTDSQQSGNLDLPVGWPQFNWSYFSYSKIKEIFNPGKDTSAFARVFGNPLQVRASDPTDSSVVDSDVAKVAVTGASWVVPLYIATFLVAWILFYAKTRWDETPRRNLTEIFGLSCTACLLSKTTFIVPFAVYLVAGLMIYHRYKIISKQNYRSYWLSSVYQWIVIGIFLASIATIVLGLVMRVRDLLF